jgi:hypothetical protein
MFDLQLGQECVLAMKRTIKVIIVGGRKPLEQVDRWN